MFKSRWFWFLLVVLVLGSFFVLAGGLVYGLGFSRAAVGTYELPVRPEHFSFPMAPRLAMFGFFPALLCLGGSLVLLLAFFGAAGMMRHRMYHAPNGSFPHRRPPFWGSPDQGAQAPPKDAGDAPPPDQPAE